MQTFLYKRKTEADNAYADPIAPLPVVDLLSGTVFRVDGVPEAADVQPVPETEQNYHRESLALNAYGPMGWRADVPKPLEIVQPEGPSFSIDGSVLSWQGWRVRIGFNYREGLVLSDVRFNDRPVMWRGSLVEMAVRAPPCTRPFGVLILLCTLLVCGYTSRSSRAPDRVLP